MRDKLDNIIKIQQLTHSSINDNIVIMSYFLKFRDIIDMQKIACV